ncbi:MAG TPA: iron-sulfur cluster-binding domain-containing protein, partial [Gemmatimonadetes bacterium]|nr:iron-sulfur cluster-binding domain-containing protein [Gemmatimonadota bacterium]
APAGGFYLDPHKDRGPVVLISAGIGITPLFSMVDSLIESGSTRKIWFFVGMRSAHSFPLREQLLAWAKDRSGFNLVIFHSQPSADERLGVDFDVRGHLTAEAVRERLGQPEADFYVCGPATMMNSMVGGLEALGIASDRIHFEAFGPASVRRAPKDVDDRIADPYSVRFARSGVSVSWDGTYDNLLSFAEAHGVPIDAGCRSGNCGTCATVVNEGTVEYVARATAKTESGTCVTCVTVPSSALVLDA